MPSSLETQLVRANQVNPRDVPAAETTAQQLGARLPAGLPQARHSAERLSRRAYHGPHGHSQHGTSSYLFLYVWVLP